MILTLLLAIFGLCVFLVGAYIMGKFVMTKVFKSFKTPVEDINPIVLKLLYIAVGFLLWTAVVFILIVFSVIYTWIAMLTY